MEKVIYLILILNIFASVGKSAPTTQSIFTQIPIDKCPKLGSSILNNASLPYFKPCRNAQLTNLPAEFSLFTIGDYLCFGIYDAEFKLCSILNENYEKIPVTTEDLQKQLEIIPKLSTEDFCDNFRKVNEKVTIHEKVLKDTLKVFYLNIQDNGCNKVCSDFNGKVNNLCLILYLINSYNYELSIENSNSGTPENNGDTNPVKSKKINSPRGAITNTGESNAELKNVNKTQQNQKEEALGISREPTTQQNREMGVKTLEKDMKHLEPEQQNTGFSRKSFQSVNSDQNVQRMQSSEGYVRGGSGIERQRPASALAQISAAGQKQELTGAGSIPSMQDDNVAMSSFGKQQGKDLNTKQNPQSIQLDPTSGGYNSVPGAQSLISSAQNPTSGGKSPVSGRQNPASGGQSHVSGGQNLASGGHNPASGGQNPASGGQNPASGKQNPASGGQNPASGEQNPASGEQNPASGGQNPATGGQNLASGGQNPASDGPSPASAGQTPVSGGERPASAGQRPASDGQSSPSGGQSPSSDGQSPSSGVSVGNKLVSSQNSGTPVDNSKLPENNSPPQQKNDKSLTMSPSTVYKPSTVKEETTESIVDGARKSENLDQTSIQNEQNIDLDQDQQEVEMEENGPVPPKTRDYTDDEEQMNEKETIRGAAEELSQSVSMKNFPEDEDSNFFSYFMFISVMFIAGYVIYHNKQKILALVLEGRRDRNSRRRPNTASYRKLNSNLEEAVTSKCSNSASHVIY